MTDDEKNALIFEAAQQITQYVETVGVEEISILFIQQIIARVVKETGQ